MDEFAIPCVGNAAHECGGFALMEEGNPTVEGSLGGISFFQWTGMKSTGRRKLFMDLCASTRQHPYSYGAALAMVIKELRGDERAALSRTRNAVVKENTPKPKNLLMARVVAFELAFERAGVKHYPSRYEWAVKARDAWNEWVRSGCPTLPAWVSPKARFAEKFGKEYGPVAARPGPSAADYIAAGFGPITGRAPLISTAPGPVEVTVEPEAVTIKAPAIVKLDEEGEVVFPTAVAKRGSWPETRLTVDEIKAVQTRMRDMGWVQAGKVDGQWSESMVSAVKRMQRAAGKSEDGHYGAETRDILAAGVVRFTPPPARTQATVAKLVAAGEPTTVAAASVKTTTAWAGFGSVGAVVVSALGDYGGTAFGLVRDAKDVAAGLPMWVYALAVCAVAYVLWHKAQAIQKQRLAEEKSGANNALAAPLPLDEGTADPSDLPSAEPSDDRDPPPADIPHFLRRPFT